MSIRPANLWLIVAILWGSLATHAPAQTPSDTSRAAALIRDLQAESVTIRRAAALQVREADRATQREAIPALIDALMKDKDSQVRLAVLDTLTMLGPDAEPAIPALLHTLKTNLSGGGREALHQDYRAAVALAAIGSPAVAGLRELLTEPKLKENVRAEAILALGRIGPASEAAIPDLIPFLGNPSERIRRDAATALGQIGPAAVAPLLAVASGNDPARRIAVIGALGQINHPDDRVPPVLLEATTDLDPLVRIEAIHALARVGLPEVAALDLARRTLEDRDPTVRLALVDFLMDHRGLLTPLAPDLAHLLLAEDAGVADHAAFLLGKLGAASGPFLVAALADSQSRIEPIGKALAAIGRPALPALEEAIIAPDPRVRRGVALALGQIRPVASGVIPRLVVGLSDPDDAVRADFLAAIHHLGPRASDAVPAVRELLHDASANNRRQVVEILARSAPRDDQLVADLTGAINDQAPEVQEEAIATLRALGPRGRPALDHVVGVVGSANPGVRLAAVLFIESHGGAAVEAIPAVTGLLADPVVQIRTSAARTLGQLGPPARPAAPGLIKLLEDDQAEVREVAALALGNLELDAATLRPALAPALRDETLNVRRAAVKTVQRLGPEGAVFIPDLIAMAAIDENLRTVDRALRPLERAGTAPRSVPELVALLDHDKVAVRLRAIKFLGLAGPTAKAVLPTLERISADPNAEISRQAKTACEQIRQEPTRNE